MAHLGYVGGCSRREAAALGLTGELVVINAARNHFRLVAHRGSFTAPAGTALEALDGKPVRVELGPNGRVLQLSQMPVHIEPIAHGFEVISGQLVLRDPVACTFSIASDDRHEAHPPMAYLGTVLANVVYVPAKVVSAAVGVVTSGVTYLATLGNSGTSRRVWDTSVGGNYVVTPSMIEGRDRIHFVG